MKYWGVRLGRGGEFVKLAQEGKFIAIGWGIKNLSWLVKGNTEDSKNKLFSIFADAYGKSTTKVERGNAAGQIMRFVREMGKGDIVIVPNPLARQILIGRIVSDYFYAFKKDACKYKHRRKVEWIQEISRDILSQPLKNSLGSLLTVFELSKHAYELSSLKAGRVKGKIPSTIYKSLEEEGPIVGETINFRGLIFAPINEQGVVFLFSKVSRDLGVEIEEIKQGFPDAIGRVKTPKGFAKRTIEFEFRSSNYDHLPQKADFLICWEHDWKGCPEDIQVIELKEVIKGLKSEE